MKAAFTPGPWNLETVKTSVGVCHKIGPLGNSTKLKDACLYDDCYSAVPRDLQLLADAHLIVAAPDLAMIVEEYFKAGCKCDEMPGSQICALCQKACNVLEKLGML